MTTRADATAARPEEEGSSRRSDDDAVRRAVWIGVPALALLLLAFSRAWVGEDAFITFRTIDQFVNGNGLRWNPDERVQSYTHPLWMFLHLPFYALTKEVVRTTTAVALVCSLLTWVLLARRYGTTPAALLVGLFLPLALSRSFALYSTSGFENPLTHLTYAIFALGYLRAGDPETRLVPWGCLALFSALCVLNRLDSVLVFVPPIALLLLTQWREVDWVRFALGISPVAAWLLFSLFYYGFPFPNTGLAKLNEEIPLSDHLLQGLVYFGDLARRDLVAFATICAGGALTGRATLQAWRNPRDLGARSLAALGAGMLLYWAYVIVIGGGFLSGRFWSLPLLVSAILCAETLRRIESHSKPAELRRRTLPIAALLFALAALSWSSLFEPPRSSNIIALPRAYAYLEKGLRWKSTVSAQMFEVRGLGLRREALAEEGAPVAVARAIGIAGMSAGRDIIIIDTHALADPLLARLAPDRKDIGMMGHFSRKPPEGYILARRSGSLSAMDPDLRAYYEPLRRIVAGPLFDLDRLRTIAAFNLGAYDHHLRAYELRRAETQ